MARFFTQVQFSSVQHFTAVSSSASNGSPASVVVARSLIDAKQLQTLARRNVKPPSRTCLVHVAFKVASPPCSDQLPTAA
jgi:hypothetical protein